MKDKEWDKKLGIDTGGSRHWKDKSLGYYMYEPTPYQALDLLMENLTFDDEDILVDFGSGKGRVPIYINYKTGIKTMGIEADYDSHSEAQANLSSYLKIKGKDTSPVSFVLDKAESYQIQEGENIFFFFNPFDEKIFRQVVANIIISAFEFYKEVFIIVFYPFPAYDVFLRMDTPFEEITNLNISWVKDVQERFIIYKFDPKKY